MTAYAASETIEITLSEDYETCVFQIQWENRDAAATVEVHSPSGTVFSESATPDQVSAGQGNVIVNVGAAHNGETWQVIVTGDGLGKVTVDGGALPGSMNIDSFTVTAVNEEKAPIRPLGRFRTARRIFLLRSMPTPVPLLLTANGWPLLTGVLPASKSLISAGWKRGITSFI